MCMHTKCLQLTEHDRPLSCSETSHLRTHPWQKIAEDQIDVLVNEAYIEVSRERAAGLRGAKVTRGPELRILQIRSDVPCIDKSKL